MDRAQAPSTEGIPAPVPPDVAVWQEVELGHYTADLPIWERMVPSGASVLELGCGSGRVALHLARKGARVMGIDSDPRLVAHLRGAGAEDGTVLRAAVADATRLSLDERFDAILAPLQLVNVVAPDERGALLRSAAVHLEEGGIAALSTISRADLGTALRLDPSQGAVGGSDEADRAVVRSVDALPDVRQHAGWVFASRPVRIELRPSVVEVLSLRETVSPDGEHRKLEHVDRFNLLDPDALAVEAADAGLSELDRIAVEPTDVDAGATILVFAAAGSDAGVGDRG